MITDAIGGGRGVSTWEIPVGCERKIVNIKVIYRENKRDEIEKRYCVMFTLRYLIDIYRT
jgi:hypothetical protein